MKQAIDDAASPGKSDSEPAHVADIPKNRRKILHAVERARLRARRWKRWPTVAATLGGHP